MKRLISIILPLCLCIALQSAEFKTVRVNEDFGNDGRYTVMLWARIPSELGQVDGSGFGVKGYAFATRGNMAEGVQFYLGTDKGVPQFKYWVPGSGWFGIVSCQIGDSPLRVKADEWFHIAGVRDGGTVTMYVNGEKVAQKQSVPEAVTATGPVNLCALEEESAYWNCRFPGFVDKWAFIQDALSEDRIKAVVSGQRDSLPQSLPSIRTAAKPDLNEELPIVKKWKESLSAQRESKDRRHMAGTHQKKNVNCTVRVVMEAGRPRVELNGKIVDATLALPNMYSRNELKTRTLQDFAAAGVKFYMDVWYTTTRLNNWWLGPDEYDFDAFDEHVRAILDACPDGYIIPRIKLDPPEWWQKDNPGEMLAGNVNPASEKWQNLFCGMLREVVWHVEHSGYAHRVAGYNFGAMVGSEWLSRRTDVPAGYDPDYWRSRAASTSVPALKAAHLIKELTGGNKLTGVFFGYPLAEHGNLMELVGSSDIDFFCSPISYNGRRAGEPGRFSTQFQGTYRLHGKLYWNEADERTHLSEYTGLWHPAWHQMDASETEGAMMRDLGWTLTSGHEIWWFAIAGSECFHDEGIMQTVRRGVELASARPAVPRASEIAVFTPVWYAPDPAENRNKELKNRFLNFIVPTCGVPVDSYELADLGNPNLPPYKAAIVVTGTHGWMPEPCDKNMKLAVFKNESDLPKTAEQLRQWCAGMGAHVWSVSDDTFGAGCGFAFIHAASDGDKTITFPDGRTWNGWMKLGQTTILKTTE